MPLSKTQEKAIQHFQGPAMVLAGPGSGKTTVITRRTAYLIEQYHIPPENILVVTFTKAAAEEMKKRFLKLRGESVTNVRFGTFHSVFFQILKAAYHFTGDNIASEDKKYTFLKEIIHRYDLEIEDENDLLKSLSSEIGTVKTERISLDHYYSVSISDEIFRKIYSDYELKMEEENLLDYDDILLFTWELLRERTDILKAWQNRFQYILIDEFQDINRLQYDVVKLLAAPQNNLFIVGDDDQSIYRFRGAKPEIMLHFPQEYPKCVQVLLDQNFRCPLSVVEAASKLIGRNITRFDKEIRGVKRGGAPVSIQKFQSQTQESLGIIKQIQIYRSIGYSFHQMAVLYRNNMDARIISQRFMEYNIPIKMREALPNIYEHWIALNLINYMKASMGNRERSLILQICNRPKRYIGRECLDEKTVNFDRVRMYYEDKVWMIKRIDQFESDLHAIGRMDPYTAINYIRHGVGYEEYLKEYADFRKIPLDELLEICDQIQESAKGFKTKEDWFTHIDSYSQMLKEQLQQKHGDIDAVTFSTLHSAKGLEYPIVFIIDVNEGIIPYKKAIMTADVEEERRMFYVGMTRAQEYLHISHVKEKNGKEIKPSPFLIGLN